MNERTDRMISILSEEWDSVVVLCSRARHGEGTEMFRYATGNSLANEKMLENMLHDMMFVGITEEDDGEEEETKGY